MAEYILYSNDPIYSKTEDELEEEFNERCNKADEANDNRELYSIETAVCKVFEIPVGNLYLKSRKRASSIPRYVCSYIRSKWRGESEHCIAERWGQNPSNITYCKRKVPEWYSTDKEFRRKVDLILKELNISEYKYSMGL
jgi:chromosomal replication initiation ATPase DnaA